MEGVYIDSDDKDPPRRYRALSWPAADAIQSIGTGC
jgi:hypothetical protein